MKQCSIIIFFVLVGSITIQAQNPTERIWNEIDSINMSMEQSVGSSSLTPLSFHTTIGTSYSFVPHFGSAMSMFVAPHADFSATKRLTFHGGIMASHTMPLTYGTDEEIPLAQGFTNMSLFVAASYHLTENLIIHGAAVKPLLGYPLSYPNLMGNQNMSFQDISFGATYNFGNFSIGATFHKSDNSMMRSPFGYGNSVFGSPFYR